MLRILSISFLPLVVSQVCTNVYPHLSCGLSYNTPEECESVGCCWDASTTALNPCYAPVINGTAVTPQFPLSSTPSPSIHPQGIAIQTLKKQTPQSKDHSPCPQPLVSSAVIILIQIYKLLKKLIQELIFKSHQLQPLVGRCHQQYFHVQVGAIPCLMQHPL